MASDEVTDSIALIEMHRQETLKEIGLAAACSEALRKLNELLDREKEALRLNGPEQGRPANVEAVAHHIQRVKQLAGAGGQRPSSSKARPPRPQQAGRPNQPRNPARNRGRRTMGRRGDR